MPDDCWQDVRIFWLIVPQFVEKFKQAFVYLNPFHSPERSGFHCLLFSLSSSVPSIGSRCFLALRCCLLSIRKLQSTVKHSIHIDIAIASSTLPSPSFRSFLPRCLLSVLSSWRAYANNFFWAVYSLFLHTVSPSIEYKSITTLEHFAVQSSRLP